MKPPKANKKLINNSDKMTNLSLRYGTVNADESFPNETDQVYEPKQAYID